MFDRNLFCACSDAHGISGHEGEVRGIFRRELKGLGQFSTGKAGNIYCTLGGGGPRVMLAAHMDEIGFLVQSVSPDGFLAIVPVGGWWNHTLPSQRVVVKTAEGRRIHGVIGAKPPHFLPEAQRNSLLPIDAMFIDIGAASAEEVAEAGIRVGDPVAPDVQARPLETPRRWMGKAFDNRAGFYAMLQTVKRLAPEILPCRLTAAGTVQEEVGTRGAKTIAGDALPDCAVILEGPPADDSPGVTAGVRQGILGGGVQIRAFDPTAIMNPELVRLACRAAEENDIPFQLTVRRTGGTDAGALHLLGAGIPCVVLGIPARYIHAHNGILDERDLNAAVDLAVALVRRLDAATVASLTDYDTLDAATAPLS